MAGDTSCPRAANATAPRGSSMRGITMTASGFSGAANVLASPISPQWATGGTVRRVASRSYALGSNGARTVRCQSNREVCMSGRTSVSWGCLLTTRPCESRGRVTLENTDDVSILPICGGNAEIDLLALVVGPFVDEAQAGKARMETAAQGIFVKAPIIIVIGSYPRAAKEECQTCLDAKRGICILD